MDPITDVPEFLRQSSDPMETFKVHAPGEQVDFIDLNGGRATVLAVTIREGRVDRYEVAWWQSGQRHTAWVEPHEICGPDTNTKQLTIGFKG